MHHFLDAPESRKERRLIWAATRSVLENVGFSRKHSGKKSRSHWDLFILLLRIFVLLLRITGFYRKGYGNAKTIGVKELTLNFPNLPTAFDGFRILHLSDLHIDSIPGFVSLLIDRVKGVKFDICLLTGDYRCDIFYTEPATLCLDTRGYDFKIAMVHTPELSRIAAENGYDLYLCGHTHGGQICLKEGHPLISHQFEGKQFNQGLWQMGKMVGYTSRGAGVSGIPIRFNCPAEITLITLKRA